MKTLKTVLVVFFLDVIACAALSAQESSFPRRSTKPVIALQDIENQTTASLGQKWDFLKRSGPAKDPISNGLREQLIMALQKDELLTVDTATQAAQGSMLKRGAPEGASLPLSSPQDTPKFVVSCSTTLSGDLVKIEVRLADSQTRKVIKTTTVEGRPEDVITSMPGDPRRQGQESLAEQAVRTAIRNAANWIRTNAFESVIVKAITTRVREEPSLQSATLTTVRQGMILQKVGDKGEWIHVRLDTGETGWVYREVVE